jgi:hypothetical protein
VIYPLLSFLPRLYDWEMQRRIFRLYGELRFIEQELDSRPAGKTVGDLPARLDRLEAITNGLRVPVSYANMLYTLRMHITLVRERLKRPEGSPALIDSL